MYVEYISLRMNGNSLIVSDILYIVGWRTSKWKTEPAGSCDCSVCLLCDRDAVEFSELDRESDGKFKHWKLKIIT